MTPQDIVVGTRLELEILGDDGERIGNVYISQLLEHQDDGTIVISAPISGSRLVYVPDGITIRLTFVDPVQGVLGFKAVVDSREYRGKVAVIIAQPGSEITKVQRRHHFRLEIVLDAVIMPADDDAAVKNDSDGGAAKKSTPLKAYTRNISGSGVCIISEKDFPKNTLLRIGLELSDGTQISTKGIVVRCREIEARKSRCYELGIKFTDIAEKDQDRLIRYIFQQQRLILKKDREREQ